MTKSNPNPIYIYDIETYQHLFLVQFESDGKIMTNRHKVRAGYEQPNFDYVRTSFMITPQMPLAKQYKTLTELYKFINQEVSPTQPTTFVGFNSIHFDDPVIVYVRQLCQQYEDPTKFTKIKEEHINNPCFALYEIGQEIIHHPQREIVKKLKRSGSSPNSLDLMSLLNPLPSLKKVEIRLRHNNVQDLPYPFDYNQPFTNEEERIVVNYCWNDIEATHLLYTGHGKQAHALRVQLQDKYGFKPRTLESLSEPQTAEKTMLDLYSDETGFSTSFLYTQAEETKNTYLKEDKPISVEKIIPDWIEFDTPELQTMLENLKTIKVPIKNTGHPDTSYLKQSITIGDTEYQMGGGGLHSVDAPAIITPTTNSYTTPPSSSRIIDVDVASYYPAILINDMLHPAHLEESWASLYKSIRDERLDAKQNGRDTDAYALKITINALFGKTSSQWSPFYDPALMLRITLTGQLALLMLIEMFEMDGVTVISANTDGVTVELQPYDSDKHFQEICEEWEEYTNFVLEPTYFSKIARRDVNNYCALSFNPDRPDDPPKIKRKGVFTRPGLKHDVQASIIQQMAEAHLLFDKPIHPSSLTTPITIYDYLYSFSATKAFFVHTRDDPDTHLQSSNRWYVSTNTSQPALQKTGGKNNSTISIPNAKRVRIMNRIDDPHAIPEDLDLEHYIAQAEKLVNTIKI